MAAKAPRYLPTPEACVDAVLERLGNKIVLGLPLGLGKANWFADAIFKRALDDADIDLTIFTALTLETPRLGSDLEKRFFEPINERIFGGYNNPDYARAVRASKLPDNIRINEFFLTPGKWLGVKPIQRDYISVNYSHGARALVALGVNVIAQMIAKRDDGKDPRYSLSSNTDVTLDVIDLLKQEADWPFVMVGEVNTNLPFMPNDAEIGAAYFDFLVDDPKLATTLFAPPKTPVGLADYAAGFHAASLVKDGGTLQIGIGSLGDAIAYALTLRQNDNAAYRIQAARLERGETPLGRDLAPRETGPFKRGLYGCSEMLVDGFVELLEAGVIKRKVYPDLELQTLLNQGVITGEITAKTLPALQKAGAVQTPPGAEDIAKLKRWGVIDPKARVPKGSAVPQSALGKKLAGGIVIHGGFFVGSRRFYDTLRALPDDTLNTINMTAISYINELYGDQALKTAQRRDARFINTGMMVTLLGAVVSDGLADGRVVSGVGGQYNFIAQAHALDGARAIIAVRATRTSKGTITSNIVWNYPHTTVPRHLRDIVVTEYGIADLRGRTDAEVIARLLNIADSRFQDELLKTAKQAGKIAPDYEIPEAYRNNTPQRLGADFADARTAGLFEPFPFGTDLTQDEISLGRALRWLEAQTYHWGSRLSVGWKVLTSGDPDGRHDALLARMGLNAPAGLREKLMARGLSLALAATEAPDAIDNPENDE